MNRLKVYRNGALTPAVYEGEVAEYAMTADVERPDGRPGRQGSLYASPSLPGVTRWTRAHLDGLSHTRDDLETYELTVDGDNVYVYDIDAWEDYSWAGKPVSAYWDSGVTLTEYLTREDRDDTNWEVLLTPEDVLSSRRVSAKRLCQHAEYPDEMKAILKRARIS